MKRDDFLKLVNIVDNNGERDVRFLMEKFRKDSPEFSKKYDELYGKNPISLDDPKGRTEWHNKKHVEVTQYFKENYYEPFKMVGYSSDFELAKELYETEVSYSSHKGDFIRNNTKELLYFPEQEIIENSNSYFIITKDYPAYFILNEELDLVTQDKIKEFINQPKTGIPFEELRDKLEELKIEFEQADHIIIPMNQEKTEDTYYVDVNGYAKLEKENMRTDLLYSLGRNADEYISILPDYDATRDSVENIESIDSLKGVESLIVGKNPIKAVGYEGAEINIYNIINPETCKKEGFLVSGEGDRNDRQAAVKATIEDLLFVMEDNFEAEKWQFHKDSVVMGYPDLETQANGYFNGGDSFGQDTLGANLYKLADNLYVVEEEDYDESGTLTIFDNEEKAKKYLSKQENILYPSIETEIENFLDNLEGIDTDDVEVEAKSTRNHGYFVEYQVMYKDFIIEDNVYSLNPEKAVQDINDFIEFEKELEENDLQLVSCEKVKNNFERGYKIEIEDLETGETYEHTRNIFGGQGYERGTLMSIKESVDELMKEIENDRDTEKTKSVEKSR